MEASQAHAWSSAIWPSRLQRCVVFGELCHEGVANRRPTRDARCGTVHHDGHLAGFRGNRQRPRPPVGVGFDQRAGVVHPPGRVVVPAAQVGLHAMGRLGKPKATPRQEAGAAGAVRDEARGHRAGCSVGLVFDRARPMLVAADISRDAARPDINTRLRSARQQGGIEVRPIQ